MDKEQERVKDRLHDAILQTIEARLLYRIALKELEKTEANYLALLEKVGHSS